MTGRHFFNCGASSIFLPLDTFPALCENVKGRHRSEARYVLPSHVRFPLAAFLQISTRSRCRGICWPIGRVSCTRLSFPSLQNSFWFWRDGKCLAFVFRFSDKFSLFYQTIADCTDYCRKVWRLALNSFGSEGFRDFRHNNRSFHASEIIDYCTRHAHVRVSAIAALNRRIILGKHFKYAIQRFNLLLKFSFFKKQFFPSFSHVALTPMQSDRERLSGSFEKANFLYCLLPMPLVRFVFLAVVFPLQFALLNLSTRNRNDATSQSPETLKWGFLFLWLGMLHESQNIILRPGSQCAHKQTPNSNNDQISE